MIDSEGYERAYELFRELLTQEPEQRWRRLDDVRADDPRLAEIVERLLANDARSAAPLDGFVLGDELRLGEVFATGARHRGLDGERISRYHLRRTIASGGMGTVYEAVQENPRRTVAVKVMRLGVSGAGARRRFDYEAQTLARLRHPGIAQVFEAGIHEPEGGDPLPYFAMEYIPNARPITDYARENGLSVRERLELFGRVCDAVHHGHQKGVIHRDLKPSNILVDPGGDPKVIDFGVARSTDSDLAVTTLRTDVGQLIGTLQYMSPEQCQANPHDLDIRSDIYALGVVLYELLCEQLPYKVTGAAVHEAIGVVREATPVRPSSFNRTLRGDIETITLMALEKDRERRYQSALDLSQDIKRYLANETILARPPSIVYQLRKFAQRHRAAAVAVVGIAATLVLGIAGTSWQAVRATRAEHDALAEASKAGTVIELLTDMLSAADPHEVKGPDYTVRELLDEFSTGLGERLDRQPEVEASVRDTIGRAYLGLGLPDAAEEQLERALELRRERLGDLDPGALGTRRSLIRVLHDRGRYAEAERAVRAMLEEVAGHERLDAIERALTSDLADLVRHLGNYAEAESLFREILEACRRELGRDDAATLAALGNLGVVYHLQGRDTEAQPLLSELVETSKRALGEEHPTTLDAQANLAATYADTGREAEAESLLRKTLAVRRRVQGDSHPATLGAVHSLAGLVRDQGRLEEAESLYDEVRAARSRVLGPEHPDTLASKNGLALVYEDWGRYAEAQQLHRDVLEARRRVLGESHPDTLNTMNNLAGVLARRGQLDQAESLYRELISLEEATPRREHPDHLMTMVNLAGVCVTQERYEDAERLYREALEALTRVLGEAHPKTLWTRDRLAGAYAHEGRRQDALELYQETLAIKRRALGEEHPSTLATMHDLAGLRRQLGDYAEAVDLYQQVLAARASVLGAEHRDTLGVMTDLGNCYATMGRYEDAEAMLSKSAEAMRRVLGIQHPWTRTAIGGLARVFEAQGRRAEAARLWGELLDDDVDRALAEDAGAGEMNRVARLLLTFRYEQLRNPQTALELAGRAAARTGHADPVVLDTLALAQHLTGDTEAAVRTETEALSLLEPDDATRPDYVARLRQFEEALNAARRQSDGSG